MNEKIYARAVSKMSEMISLSDELADMKATITTLKEEWKTKEAEYVAATDNVRKFFTKSSGYTKYRRQGICFSPEWREAQDKIASARGEEYRARMAFYDAVGHYNASPQMKKVKILEKGVFSLLDLVEKDDETFQPIADILPEIRAGVYYWFDYPHEKKFHSALSSAR